MIETIDIWILVGFLFLGLIIYAIIKIRKENKLNKEMDDIWKVHINCPKDKGFKGDIIYFVAGDEQFLEFNLQDESSKDISKSSEFKYVIKRQGRPDKIIFEKFGSNKLELKKDDTENLKGSYDLFIYVLLFDEYNSVSAVYLAKKIRLVILGKIE